MKRNILMLTLLCVMAKATNAQSVPLLPVHGLNVNQPAYIETESQVFAMEQGWNWWSTYIDMREGGLNRLEAALGENADLIKSKTQFVAFDSVWSGSLDGISNDQMYMIKLTNTPENDVRIAGALRLSADDVVINAQPGWSWIGFPNDVPVELNEAMTEYALFAGENDLIKSKNQFAIFCDSQWTGSLTMLEPGFGYMIRNNGDEAVPFHFSQTGETGERKSLKPSRWNASSNGFPTNMSMIAAINLEGKELPDGNFELAAFAGDDCRGAVAPQFVESQNRYVAFLTIAGDENDVLQFRLADNTSNMIYLSENQYEYSADAVEGTLSNPYVLSFNACIGVDENADKHIQLFPNPAKSGNRVTLVLSFVPESGMTVEIVNMLGVVVKRERLTQSQMDLPVDLAPGVYHIKVVCNEKQLCSEKLVLE